MNNINKLLHACGGNVSSWSNIFPVHITLQQTPECINLLPSEQQWVTLHFTFDVEAQRSITRSRTPSSGNGYARYGVPKKWRYFPRVRGITGTLCEVCFRYLQDRSAVRTAAAQPIRLPLAVYVSKNPGQVTLTSTGAVPAPQWYSLRLHHILRRSKST